ncbi:MAG: hypothetical protein ACK5QT_06710 [Oligoflexia bacterium]
MREYPWLERPHHWGQVARYRVIRDSALLTRAWCEAVSAPLSTLQRKGVWPEFEKALVLLHAVDWSSQEFPSHLLGAMKPDEFLNLVSAGVRIQQGLVLDQILKKQESHLLGILERATFEFGRRTEARIEKSVLSARSVFWALSQAGGEAVVERATDGCVRFLDLGCPHRDPHLEVKAVADRLCDLQMFWRRGFCAALAPELQLVRLEPDGRGHCRFDLFCPIGPVSQGSA